MTATGRRLAIALALLPVSCSLERLRADESAKDVRAVVTGKVAAPAGVAGRTVAVLYRAGGRVPEIEGYDVPADLVRSYAFIVSIERRYVLVAFLDRNGNLVWDAGEPVGSLGLDAPVAAKPRQVLALEDITLAAGGTPPAGFELDLRGVPATAATELPLALGEVTSLDHDRFAPERGEAGMWTSLHALRSAGFGLYFLEPYDPTRVPVLLVHGIAGTPRDFTAMIASLDRTRFQPWVYHYPTGLRLGLASETLAAALARLHETLGFDVMAVVAHSMGGLVARSAILSADARPAGAGYVRLFVTFATPWLGHASATTGVTWIESPVPAWVDMAPESDFLRALRSPLPPGLPYFLFFGFGGGRSLLLGEANDGVVTVASELAQFAQDEAAGTWGYDLDHMEILSDPAPLARLARTLAVLSTPTAAVAPAAPVAPDGSGDQP